MLNNDRKRNVIEELKKIMEAEALSDPRLTKDEQEKLIKLAGIMIQTDYGSESEFKENLKKKLLSKDFDCELEDDELDYAAGGIMPMWEEKDDKDK